jgi:hypothetical protein
MYGFSLVLHWHGFVIYINNTDHIGIMISLGLLLFFPMFSNVKHLDVFY